MTGTSYFNERLRNRDLPISSIRRGLIRALRKGDIWVEQKIQIFLLHED